MADFESRKARLSWAAQAERRTEKIGPAKTGLAKPGREARRKEASRPEMSRPERRRRAMMLTAFERLDEEAKGEGDSHKLLPAKGLPGRGSLEEAWIGLSAG
jgi:hypothetical protein